MTEILLHNKNILIAGVANDRSIAWGIARRLHAHGANLAFTCFPTGVRRVTKLAASLNCNRIFPCDVSNDDHIEAACASAAAAWDGRIDSVVHAVAFAHIEDIGGEFIRTTRTGWTTAMEISAYSLVAMARFARPFMKDQGGSIMTLSYQGSVRIVPNYNVMGVAKAALESAVRYLAYDLGPDRIRVNALSPGPIETMSAMVIDNFNKALELTASHAPLLCNVTPEDIGNAAVFLASDLSSKITGTVIPIDAGMHALAAPGQPHDRRPV